MNTPTLNTLLPLLDELGEQVENALQTPDGISLLEKDLLKETLRRFYDAVEVLPVVNHQPMASPVAKPLRPAPIMASEKEVSVSHEVIATLRGNQLVAEKNAPLVAEKPVEEAIPVVEAKPLTVATQPVAETIVTHEDQTSPVLPVQAVTMQEEIPAAPLPMNVVLQEAPVVAEVAPVTVKAPVEEKVVETRAKHLHAAAMFEEQATVAARYSAQETIGDKVTKDSTTRRLSDQLKTSPLADLKASIGINERFAFINELFAGDQQSYLQSIESINRLQTYQEAHELIHGQLMQLYVWKPQSERFRQFDDLVKRRFNA